MLTECCFYRNSHCVEFKSVVLQIVQKWKETFPLCLPISSFFCKWDILTYIKLLKRDVRRICREKDLIPDIYSGQRPVFINRFLEYFCLASSEIRLLFLSKQKCIGSRCELCFFFLVCVLFPFIKLLFTGKFFFVCPVLCSVFNGSTKQKMHRIALLFKKI